MKKTLIWLACTVSLLLSGCGSQTLTNIDNNDNFHYGENVSITYDDGYYYANVNPHAHFEGKEWDKWFNIETGDRFEYTHGEWYQTADANYPYNRTLLPRWNNFPGYYKTVERAIFNTIFTSNCVMRIKSIYNTSVLYEQYQFDHNKIIWEQFTDETFSKVDLYEFYYRYNGVNYEYFSLKNSIDILPQESFSIWKTPFSTLFRSFNIDETLSNLCLIKKMDNVYLLENLIIKSNFGTYVDSFKICMDKNSEYLTSIERTHKVFENKNLIEECTTIVEFSKIHEVEIQDDFFITMRTNNE